jgi:hypothetical protein
MDSWGKTEATETFHWHHSPSWMRMRPNNQQQKAPSLNDAEIFINIYNPTSPSFVGIKYMEHLGIATNWRPGVFLFKTFQHELLKYNSWNQMMSLT